METSLGVRSVRSQDECTLSRWLSMQERVFTRFAVKDLAGWIAAGDGLLAESGGEPVGLMLYTEASRARASVIGVAVDNGWSDAEILFLLFHKAVQRLQGYGFAMMVCVSDAGWLGTGLREHAGFEFTGYLVSYLKVDQDIPDFGNQAVHISPASADDIQELLNIDKSAFPALWQQEQHIMIPSSARHGYIFKAEWHGMIVGYASGAWYNQQGHISRLAVHPQLHRQGIGKRLLAESIAHFHRKGIHNITLNTQADNVASRRLYEQYRFEAVNTEIQVLVRAIARGRKGNPVIVTVR